MIGQIISHYKIVSQLGSGGMGVVYTAEDTLLGRQVALKFVASDAASDRQAVERLRIEARAASALNHANICTIYEFGEHEGRPFIVMELMKGRTLRDRLTSGALAIHQVIEIGIQIADALDAAHSQGIMHRDIKPANIFLTERGNVKILDFGLAKLLPRHNAFETTATPLASDQLTQAGVAIGTVLYMSPEQATGEDLDGRTDLFSLGVVLYECVTGRRPFSGKTAAVVLDQILNRAPVAAITYAPDLPVRLQDVINNCLEKDRELRYQSADALRADLKRIKRDIESGHFATAASSDGQVVAGASGAARKLPASGSAQVLPTETAHRSKSPMMWLGGAAVLLVLGALVYFQPWQRSAPQQAVNQESPAQTTPTPTEPSTALVESRLELAATSLKARNYSAAVTYADEVLRAVPGHPGATNIRAEAQAMIARLDQALSDARRLLASNDADGAARALERARAIDPSAPAIVELSAELVNHFRGQADAARRSKATTQVPVVPPKPTGQASSSPAPAPVQPSASPPASAPPPAARTEPPPQSAPAVTAPAPQPAAPEPVTRPPEPTRPAETAPRPAEPPATAPPVSANGERRERAADPPARPAEDDEAAIRKVIATYGRAIETKSISLFRSVKPNLSAEEERRITAGFRSVTSQQVAITILSIDRRGDTAVVRLRRRDTVMAGGRQQTSEGQQTITLSKPGSWVIEQIGQ
jgi:serine/threonine protein kinase